VRVQLYEIRLYEAADGHQPFADWLASFRDLRARARIEQRISRLMKGNFGDCKPLKNASGVHELRLDFGPGYRVYFGIEERVILLLLTGGDKSSQDKDIRKAINYWHEYQRRRSGI
jgi:putative addiction module killer protein